MSAGAASVALDADNAIELVGGRLTVNESVSLAKQLLAFARAAGEETDVVTLLYPCGVAEKVQVTEVTCRPIKGAVINRTRMTSRSDVEADRKLVCAVTGLTPLDLDSMDGRDLIRVEEAARAFFT